MKRAAELPESGERVVKEASGEFDALGGLEKINAIGASAQNVKNLTDMCKKIEGACKKW